MPSRSYTPALRPSLLRGLHRLSKATHVPMTRLLDAALRTELRRVREHCGPQVCRSCLARGLDEERHACRACAFAVFGDPGKRNRSGRLTDRFSLYKYFGGGTLPAAWLKATIFMGKTSG